MTRFGLHLKALIDENDINLYSLAKTTGIERTAIYKIISDGRIVSDEFASKLADALQLSPEERQSFLENHKISKIGEFKYSQRQHVKRLIERLADVEKYTSVAYGAGAAANEGAGSGVCAGTGANINVSDVNRTPAQTYPRFYKSNTVLTGNLAVFNLIKSLIEDVIATDNPSIDFVMPGSNKQFYDELLVAYMRRPDLKIRHITGFTKRVDFGARENKNLEILSQILPFVYVSDTSYEPHYFYQKNQEPEPTQAMPYFILTSANKLLLLDRNCEKAWLVLDSDALELYKAKFQAMLDSSKPLLFYLSPSVDALMQHYISVKEFSPETPKHWINADMVIDSLITVELLNKYVKEDVPDRKELLKLSKEYFNIVRKSRETVIGLSTTDGVIEFLKSGRIMGTVPDITHPLSREDAVKIIKSQRRLTAQNKVKLFFTNPSKFNIPKNTIIWSSGSENMMFIVVDSKRNIYKVAGLEEESITSAFCDFAESIEDSDLVLGKEESLAFLDSIIKS